MRDSGSDLGNDGSSGHGDVLGVWGGWGNATSPEHDSAVVRVSGVGHYRACGTVYGEDPPQGTVVMQAWYVALQEVCMSLQEMVPGSVLPFGHEAFGQILAAHQTLCCRKE